MGAWKKWINRITDAVKICKSNVPRVKEAWRKGYDVSRHVDGAVRTKARVIHEYFSDDQVRDFLTRTLKHMSTNGALYIVRTYGGGPIIDIVSASLQSQDAASQKKRLKELENKVAKLERALCSRKFRVEADIYMAYSNSHDKLGFRTYLKANINPEEILRIFLMKHLCLKILDDFVMVNIAGSQKNVKGIRIR